MEKKIKQPRLFLVCAFKVTCADLLFRLCLLTVALNKWNGYMIFGCIDATIQRSANLSPAEHCTISTHSWFY